MFMVLSLTSCTEYGVSIEEDVRTKIEDADSHALLLALLQDRPDSDVVDEDLANTDAHQLLQVRTPTEMVLMVDLKCQGK